MLIKCKCHGIKIDRDTAYKISVKGKNEYYCSEKEYNNIQQEKQSRSNVLNTTNDVFGYVVINTALNKELSEIAKIHTYFKIDNYLKENINNLKKFMSKSFSSEFGKIKYYAAILKNNLGDYRVKEVESQVESVIEVIEYVNYTKAAKNSIMDYINDYNG